MAIREKDRWEASQQKAENKPFDVNITVFDEIGTDELNGDVEDPIILKEIKENIRKKLKTIDNIHHVSLVGANIRNTLYISVTTTEVFNDNESYDSQMTDYESKLDVKVNDILHGFCN